MKHEILEQGRHRMHRLP